MYKINIPVNQTTDAIHWAAKHCKVGSFNVRHDFPSTSYIFMFDSEQDAIHFALKWQ